MPRLGGGEAVRKGPGGRSRDVGPHKRYLIRKVASLKRALAVCQARSAAAAADHDSGHWSFQLREIDHRAKNSLQLAASMLLIHGKTTDDADVRRQLESAATRLMTLARLHAVLHEGVGGQGVPVRSWLERVCEGLNGEGVAIVIVAPDEAWPVEVARPIGLFTFEAVTNSLKHGFRDGAPGHIEVSLIRNGAAHRLEVVDDGAGSGGGPCSGLGLTLCQIFADQLEGVLSITPGLNDRGFRTGIDFPGPALKARGQAHAGRRPAADA